MPRSEFATEIFFHKFEHEKAGIQREEANLAVKLPDQNLIPWETLPYRWGQDVYRKFEGISRAVFIIERRVFATAEHNLEYH